MVLFVSSQCPDCPPALQWAKDQGLQLEVIDITGSMKNLKTFLALRDRHPYFKEVKEMGQVGIPVFYLKDQDQLVPFHQGLSLEDLR